MTEEEAGELKAAFEELQTRFQEVQATVCALQEVVAQKEQRIAELEGQLIKERLRNAELERRLAKTSRTSSQPPSRDGYSRQFHPRKKSERPSGGQSGHQGQSLKQVAVPDQVIVHRPQQCGQCHSPLPRDGGQVKERRQVFDVPPLRLEVTEHQAWARSLPSLSAPDPRLLSYRHPGSSAVWEADPGADGLLVAVPTLASGTHRGPVCRSGGGADGSRHHCHLGPTSGQGAGTDPGAHQRPAAVRQGEPCR